MTLPSLGVAPRTLALPTPAFVLVMLGSLLLAAACDAATTSSGEDSLGVPALTRVEVHGDEDGDGALSPGESGRLALMLRGVGGKVPSAKVSVRTDTAGVPLTGGDDHPCGTLRREETVPCTSAWAGPKLTVPASTPAGTVIALTIDVVAEHGSWSLPATLTVKTSGALPEIALAKVIADSNGDGQLNAGEEARLELRLANRGSADLPGATLLVTTDSSSIASLTRAEALYCGKVGAGAEALCSDWSSPALTVSNTAAPGPVRFDVVVQATTGAVWDLSFEVPIVATGARPVLEGVELLNDDDGDGRLNRGEEAGIRLTLRNAGTSRVVGANVQLNIDAGPAELTRSTPISCGGIDPGQTVSCGGGFSDPEILVDDDAPYDATVTLLGTISDQQGVLWDVSTSIPLPRTGANPTVATWRTTTTGGASFEADRSSQSLVIEVANGGTSKAVGVRATILPRTAEVTVGAQAVGCGTIAPGKTAQCESLYASTSGTAAGPTVTLDVTLRDDLGNSWGPFAISGPVVP